MAIPVKKHAKAYVTLFFSSPILLDFSALVKCFIWDCLSKQNLIITRPSLLQTFWHFVYHQSISPILTENIRQVSWVKLLNLVVLCKQYFAYLGQKLTLEYFHVYLLVVLWQNQLFSNKWEFFPESSIIIGSVDSKNKIFRQSWL